MKLNDFAHLPPSVKQPTNQKNNWSIIFCAIILSSVAVIFVYDAYKEQKTEVIQMRAS